MYGTIGTSISFKQGCKLSVVDKANVLSNCCSFNNLYQLNTIVNDFNGDTIDLCLSTNNNITISRSVYPLFSTDIYHPALIIEIDINNTNDTILNSSELMFDFKKQIYQV